VYEFIEVKMQKEIVIALIAAIATVVGAIVTLVLGLRNINITKEKLAAEISKLQAEAKKIAAEANAIERQRIETERSEVKELLTLFDGAVFDAPMHSEDPSEMFHAIQRVRILLQKNGASLVRDRLIADNFREIRKILLRAENEVAHEFPIIEKLAYELSGKDRYERWHRAKEVLGEENYFKPVRIMMDIRHDIYHHLDIIKRRFYELYGENA
jgi:hypothetical protein